MLKIYQWIIGSQTDFLNPYAGAPTKYQLASQFWNNLGNYAPIAVGILILVSILFVFIYYKPFNDAPGRHYQPKYWCMFLIVNAIITFGITYLSEVFIIKTSLNNVASYEIKIAIANMLYSLVLFIVFSMIWCKSLPTNAYKIF